MPKRNQAFCLKLVVFSRKIGDDSFQPKIECFGKLRIDFLKKILPVVDNKISRSSFDEQGNFAFGLKEHIEILLNLQNPYLLM
jgi:hypothetical protein